MNRFSLKRVSRRVQPSDPMIALRHRVRGAGETGYQSRLALRLVGAAAFFLFASSLAMGLLGNYFNWLSGPATSFWHVLFRAYVPVAGITSTLILVPALAVGFPVRGLHGMLRRRALRKRLSALPPERSVEVLEPLATDPVPETRRLAARLLRDLQARRAELAPAPPPAGRGDELSVANG